MKKCTGESGDIGDIAKNVKIAMQKNDMRIVRILRNLTFLGANFLSWMVSDETDIEKMTLHYLHYLHYRG